MSITTGAPVAQQSTPDAQIDRALNELADGQEKLAKLTIRERIELAHKCLQGVFESADEWVELACRAKGIPEGHAARAEENLAGPTATARYLRLLIGSLRDIERDGRPDLAGRISKGPGDRLRVRTLPDRGLFDRLTFFRMAAHSWLSREVDEASLTARTCSFPEPAIVLVLGAGNVSSIPATDAFTRIFQDNRVVLLKMNPVNDYLGPLFERAFAHLIEPGFLRLAYGGADVGAVALDHELVDEVHITGSIESHDSIVWGPRGEERERRKQQHDPQLAKPITSELANVSPWIVVPGAYTDRQMNSQVENITSSITNNASFNCVATKVILTWKRWPERERFLERIEQTLDLVPLRKAYYPGAEERFCRFARSEPPPDADGTLPWTLIRDVDPDESPLYFNEESFVCVCVETALDAETPAEFLQRAVEFANERTWGTLCAAITAPRDFRRRADNEAVLQSCIDRLEYGSVGINQWPALLFALMSAPWGGYPGSPLEDVQSGRGFVHNTLFLPGVEKTVLEAPLTMIPKPFWFPTHPNPEPVAHKLLELYEKPTIWRLMKLMTRASAGLLS